MQIQYFRKKITKNFPKIIYKYRCTRPRACSTGACTPTTDLSSSRRRWTISLYFIVKTRQMFSPGINTPSQLYQPIRRRLFCWIAINLMPPDWLLQLIIISYYIILGQNIWFDKITMTMFNLFLFLLCVQEVVTHFM